MSDEFELRHAAQKMLLRCFEVMALEEYAIVRQVAPLRCRRGGDVDIFCRSAIDVVKRILQLTVEASGAGFEIDVKLFRDGEQVHVDFLAEGKLEFRLDLYATMPPYNRVLMQECFFDAVLESRQCQQTLLAGECVELSFQGLEDQCILRYLEYHEYYPTRPDKVRHLDWVIHSCEDSDLKVRFLKRLHFFTATPAWCSIAQESSVEATESRKEPLLFRAVRQLRWKLYCMLKAVRGNS